MECWKICNLCKIGSDSMVLKAGIRKLSCEKEVFVLSFIRNGCMLSNIMWVCRTLTGFTWCKTDANEKQQNYNDQVYVKGAVYFRSVLSHNYHLIRIRNQVCIVSQYRVFDENAYKKKALSKFISEKK